MSTIISRYDETWHFDEVVGPESVDQDSTVVGERRVSHSDLEIRLCLINTPLFYRVDGNRSAGENIG